jgi:hypothetical protein
MVEASAFSSGKTQVAPKLTVDEVRMSVEQDEGGGVAHGVDQGSWRERDVDVMILLGWVW